MTKLAQLREHRDAKAKEAHELNNKYPADQRMPAEDAAKLDALLGEVEAIDADISREQKVMAVALENSQHETLLNKATKDPAKQTDESKALRAYLSGGLSAVNEDARAIMRARQTPDIMAAMSTTTGSEGGYTVAEEWHRSLDVAMKSFGGIRQVATMIRTGTGATMNFPAADATAEEGEIVGQNAPTANQDTTFQNIVMDVYRYSSKSIALPFELLQDTFIDIEAYIQELLTIRLGRITNRHFTVGTGTGQPMGIVTASVLGKAGATGSATSVTYNDLVDLEHSVDPAYRDMSGVGYMFHDTTLQAIRKYKDDNARPIFVPGYEQGNPGGAPDRLLGRPITINQNMPVMAANAKSILFGQLSKYIIRDVMDLTIFRMTDSAFTLKGQVGFVAFRRSGGNLVDVGGAVKHYQNSAS